MTRIQPYTRAVLDAIQGDAPPPTQPEVPRAGDIGDWIDPNAPDPTPPVVTDRDDPSFVDPWFGGQ